MGKWSKPTLDNLTPKVCRHFGKSAQARLRFERKAYTESQGFPTTFNAGPSPSILHPLYLRCGTQFCPVVLLTELSPEQNLKP